MMVNVLLSNVRVEVLALNEAQKEFVDNLNVGPSHLKNRLIFLRIKSLALRIHWRWDWAEQILAEHLHNSRIHLLCDDLSVVRHVIKKLVECQSLDLLGLHISTCVVEIEDDVALINLLHEQLLPAIGWDFVEARKFVQFSLALVGNVKS